MTHSIPQSRAERLIAACRLTLAVASLGAIYLDPLEPSRMPATAYTLLTGYALYAFAVMAWTAAARTTSRRWMLASHLLDMTFFGLLNYMTAGPTSPFFVYFVFGIICAMLRFGRRGTLMTALLAIFVFVTSGVHRIPEQAFELNRFIIRGVYLVVLASMLMYLAAYHERVQRDLAQIASWPRSPRRDHAELIASLMREVASIFGAPRALLSYEHLSERYTYQAVADGDSVEITELAAQPRSETGVATPFKGEFVRGELLLDGAPSLLEEIRIAEIAGTVIAGRLDHFHAALQLQRGAVAEERVRVARDLHDSVLQSLTGVALQLRTLPRLMKQNPEEAQKRIAEIEQVIVSGQKELRWFIEELRPRVDRSGGDDVDDLDERLLQLAQRFREQWALEVENEVSPVVHLLPVATRYEIYAIVNEAVANAAKHAGAKKISVAIDVAEGQVHVDVADDGRGFPFHGRYDLQSLLATNRGPMTLKERVSSLGGSMVIDSSEAGARVEIRVPLASSGA
ncbi:MAG TPA: sensor histidine kinase [Thermoanaerobaculia bacterium]|nr:sensor histidine kinase [Thermoanaerobaculia bacterium]